jgi:hypothetical protein
LIGLILMEYKPGFVLRNTPNLIGGGSTYVTTAYTKP